MQTYSDSRELAEKIVAQVGPDIVLALPLGLGKANHIANALYEHVAADDSLSLTILTALTPEKPVYTSELQQRFMRPVVERLFGEYPELLYARDRRQQCLPKNIRIEEFFFLASSQLGNATAQQNYICANYTHALQYLLQRGVNVLAQLVAVPPTATGATAAGYESDCFSASCNADFTRDMLQARDAGEADFLFACQVNRELPFFGGDAFIAAEEVNLLLGSPALEFPLFAPPKAPVSLHEYAAGMHVASLIVDGGTLQIGIGSVADAVAHCLILRHRDPQLFQSLLRGLSHGQIPQARQVGSFTEGLHGVSEMLVDSFLNLYDAGILRREVQGIVLHAAFFLGPKQFYRRLYDLEENLRQRINLCSVLYANELYGDEAGKREQRQKARFINRAMMVTLMGEVVSDGLDDGRVISGVGGQYNFVAQAFALRDARSVIVVPATRMRHGKPDSNILWSYGHCTIPRHLRDIVVTEYGVADLRGKTDAEVIAAMLAIADSRFQPQLLAAAKRAGKVPADFEIQAQWCNNYPQSLRQKLVDQRERFPAFPFGTDFTEVEQRLMPCLQRIQSKAHSKPELLKLAWRGATAAAPSPAAREMLQRLALLQPAGYREWLYRWLLLGAMALGDN